MIKEAGPLRPRSNELNLFGQQITWRSSVGRVGYATRIIASRVETTSAVAIRTLTAIAGGQDNRFFAERYVEPLPAVFQNFLDGDDLDFVVIPVLQRV